MENSLYEQEKELRDSSREHLKWAGIRGGIAALNGYAVMIDAIDGQLSTYSLVVNGSAAICMGVFAVSGMAKSNQLSNHADAICIAKVEEI